MTLRSISSVLVTAIAIFLIGSYPASSQARGGDERRSIVLSDAIMEQVVSQVLNSRFKPSHEYRLVEIFDPGYKKSSFTKIDPAWLPKIENIEFQLVTKEELDRFAREVHFFTKITKEDKKYKIGFGFGDPFCSYSGSYWSFKANAVKPLLISNEGFGGGCGHGSGK